MYLLIYATYYGILFYINLLTIIYRLVFNNWRESILQQKNGNNLKKDKRIKIRNMDLKSILQKIYSINDHLLP